MSHGKRLKNAIKQGYKLAFKGGGTVECFLCKKPIRHYSDLTIDHVLPFSVLGTHERNNLKPSHGHCNAKKADWVIPELVYETDEAVNNEIDKRKVQKLIKEGVISAEELPAAPIKEENED